MKKFIFFVLFLSLCSISVYAYFYWKAIQFKTPVVSVDLIIPKREVLKKRPVRGRMPEKLRTSPASVKKEQIKDSQSRQNVDTKEVLKNTETLKGRQEAVSETEKFPPSFKGKGQIREKTDSSGLKQEDIVKEKPEQIDLLIPTTEPIAKEELLPSSQP